MGAQPSLDELAEQYGADNCAYLEDLKQMVSASNLDVAIVPDQLSKEVQDIIDNTKQPIRTHWEAQQQTEGLVDVLSACRAIKTDSDVACLKHASEVSTRAHLAMWR